MLILLISYTIIITLRIVTLSLLPVYTINVWENSRNKLHNCPWGVQIGTKVIQGRIVWDRDGLGVEMCRAEHSQGPKHPGTTCFRVISLSTN